MLLIGKNPLKNNVFTNSNYNDHILVTGSSGTGKTYLLKNFILQTLKKNSVLIIDGGNSFSDNETEETFELQTAAIKYSPQRMLPINPFSPKNYTLGDSNCSETAIDVANRLSQLVKITYNLGYKQLIFLEDNVLEMLNNKSCEASFENLCKNIERHTDQKNRFFADNLRAYVNGFSRSVKFSTDSKNIWEELLAGEPKLIIFQLSSLNGEALKTTADIVMDDLFKHMTNNVGKKITIILDEFQNLNCKDNSIFTKILAEGRKYGISAICSTQTLDFAKNNTKSKLQQAGTKIYFKPSDSEIKKLLKLLPQNNFTSAKWLKAIKEMQRGMCIVVNGEICNDLAKLVFVARQPLFYNNHS